MEGASRDEGTIGPGPKKQTMALPTGLEDMSEVHKEKLIVHHEQLVETLAECIKDIADYMNFVKSLDKDQTFVIKTQPNPSDSVRCLLRILPKLSEKAYSNFLDAICDLQSDERVGLSELYESLKDCDSLSFLQRRQKCLYGIALEYHKRLKTFHKSNLARGIPLRVNLKSYIKLTMYPRTLKLPMLARLRVGLRESELGWVRTQGDRILPADLFKRQENNHSDIRCVLMLGAPGVGKTMTAFHFLQEHSTDQLWYQDIRYVIFILFREVNHFEEDISLQDLLFSFFGPMLDEDGDKDKVWKYILQHQDSILFIVDGFDECLGLGVNVDDRYTIRFYDTKEKTKIQVLLHNLIMGNLLPKSRLLVTSRPHCVDKLEQSVSRTIELAGLDLNDILDLIKRNMNHKPLLARSLINHLNSKPSLISICSCPVNAQGLIDFVLCQELEQPDREISQETLPATRAALMLLLTLNLLQQHDRSHQESSQRSLKELLLVHRELFIKLTHLAYSGIFDEAHVKQVFDGSDLEKFELSVEKVTSSGLMTGHVSMMKDFFKKINKILLSFPHLTFQENLSSVKTSLDKFEELMAAVDFNTGEKDVVILHTLGILSDPLCRDLLSYIHKDLKPEKSIVRCQELLQEVWLSPRRCQEDGPLFCITCLAESLQHQKLAGTLAGHIITPLETLYISDVVLTSADFSPLASFLNHLCKPIKELVISISDESVGFGNLLNASGYRGMTVFAPSYTKETLAMLSQSLNTKIDFTFVMMKGSTEKPCSLKEWSSFNPAKSCGLRALGLRASMVGSKETLEYVCHKLCNLNSLEAIYIRNIQRLSAESGSLISPLRKLSSLRYLRLCKCDLGPKDIPYLLDLIMGEQFRYLDLSNNPLFVEGVCGFVEGLKKSAITGLRLLDCSIEHDGIKAIGSSLQYNKALLTLTVSYATCSDSLEPLETSLRKGSVLRELNLHKCNLSENDIEQIANALMYNHTLTWLLISGDQVHSSFMTRLSAVLKENKTLQALCVRDAELTDELLLQVAPDLCESMTLELFDISENHKLTATTIVQIIEQSCIKHLALSDTQLGPVDGWQLIAKALLTNKHLKQCVVGDAGMEKDLWDFLDMMCQYPSDGPLEHLHVYGDSDNIIRSLCRLQNTLRGRCSVNLVEFGLAFKVLSGLWNQDLPRDISMWLFTVHTTIK